MATNLRAKASIDIPTAATSYIDFRACYKEYYDFLPREHVPLCTTYCDIPRNLYR